MEDINENDVIMYEESKEIKETIWKIWDLINDKEIVSKLLNNSTLINELEKSQSQNILNINNNKLKDKLDLIIEDIQYDFHLKIITYKIESSLLSNQNFNDKNKSEIYTPENSSNNRKSTDINYIKLIFTLQPNTLEETKLLTITMIDFSETLNEDQLENIIKSIFISFNDIIVKEVPLTKNCESIIINANINIVFDFWENWKFKYLDEKILKTCKIDGEPNKIGTKIHLIYFDKISLVLEILEINRFYQKGNEDDTIEWNYKHKNTYEDGESETLNVIFISCENGTKTYVSFENKINEKVKVKRLTEYSSRKLKFLNEVKKFIEIKKEK